MKTRGRRLGAAGVLLCLCFGFRRGPPSAQGHTSAQQEELNATTRAFLMAIRRGAPDNIRQYFPRIGNLTYVHTSHQHDGDHVGMWRFAAEDAARQLNSPGPIFEAVQLSPEGQPVGLLVNQVLCRGISWTRARRTRFVPPGADASSPVFVEWRRESRRWVVASFGDESFPNDSMPGWQGECW